MKSNTKKPIIMIIVLILLTTLLPLSSYAAVDNSKSFLFDFTADNSHSVTVAVDDEILFQIELKRIDNNKNGSYPMHSMQNEFIYDSEVFSYVEGSFARKDTSCDFHIRDMEDGIHKRIILSKFVPNKDGETVDDELILATFKMKVLKTETSVIESRNYKVNNNAGIPYATTSNDMTITVGGTENGETPPSPGDGSEDGNESGGSSGSGGVGGLEPPVLPDDADSPSAGFDDVDQDAWYREAVDFVLKRGLFVGTSDTTFSPNIPMSRAMLVTVLWRLEGEPTVSGSEAFKDVEKGSWYDKAVAWANANQIVLGYGDSGLFKPKDNISREQMAVILYRYAKWKNYDLATPTNLGNYDDAGYVSSWAMEEMRWAVAEGLITGVTTKTLVPVGNASRAQVASILMRFTEKFTE